MSLLVIGGLSAVALACSSETSATPAPGAKSSATVKTTASGGTSAGAAAGTIGVELSEWAVKAGGPGRAGSIKFNVKNNGTTPHEFVILKTDADPATLTKDASARVDETKYPVAGRTKEVNAGATDSVEASLTAGKYVLICNLSGHYDLGMRTPFTVN
jgi:uncharacterized cupredoxin-like copper-binding protein